MNIRGIIFDDEGNPLDGAHVVYLNSAGEYEDGLPGAVTTPLTGVFPGGFFELPYIPGQQIRVSFTGFEPAYINVPLENPNAPNDYFVEKSLEWGVQDLPPVTIRPKKSPWPILALVAVAYYATK